MYKKVLGGEEYHSLEKCQGVCAGDGSGVRLGEAMERLLKRADETI